MVAASTVALFTGAWSLVNVTRDQGGSRVIEPLFGDHPAGVISYSPNGYINVVLQSTDDLSALVGITKPEASLLAIAYSGPFTINNTYPVPDERHGEVLHGPLISSNVPGFPGMVLPRVFAFSEDDQYLELSANIAGLEEHLLWKKLPQHDSA